MGVASYPCLIPAYIWKYRGLLWQWTKRLLAMRHAGSLLGPVWNFATPLLMLAVYTFVFGIVFKARWQMLDTDLETTGSYAVILFCGMATFNIFAETISGSARCVIDNANLVKKVIFPLEILPAAQMLCAAITGQAWFLLVLCGALVAGIPMHASIFLFPVSLLPLMAFSLGIGWFVAATTVFLRDIPHLTAMLLQALFFMTPIFYPESLVPPSLLPIIELNPLTWLCRQVRGLLLFGSIPSLLELALTWLGCGVVCQLGFVWFMKVKKGFADVI